VTDHCGGKVGTREMRIRPRALGGDRDRFSLPPRRKGFIGAVELTGMFHNIRSNNVEKV